MRGPLIALLILVLTFPARAFELLGLRISHSCRGRAEPGASWTRYVDGFLEAGRNMARRFGLEVHF